jgi:hypothetical protein
MMLIFMHAKYESCGVIKAPIQISKKSLGSQAMCTRVIFHTDSPEWAMCDVVREKPNMLWRLI